MSNTAAMTREQGYDRFLTDAENDLRSALVDGIHIEFERVDMEATDEDKMTMFTAKCENCPKFSGVQGAIFSDIAGAITFMLGNGSYRNAEDLASAMWEILELEVIDDQDNKGTPTP